MDRDCLPTPDPNGRTLTQTVSRIDFDHSGRTAVWLATMSSQRRRPADCQRGVEWDASSPHHVDRRSSLSKVKLRAVHWTEGARLPWRLALRL